MGWQGSPRERGKSYSKAQSPWACITTPSKLSWGYPWHQAEAVSAKEHHFSSGGSLLNTHTFLKGGWRITVHLQPRRYRLRSFSQVPSKRPRARCMVLSWNDVLHSHICVTKHLQALSQHSIKDKLTLVTSLRGITYTPDQHLKDEGPSVHDRQVNLERFAKATRGPRLHSASRKVCQANLVWRKFIWKVTALGKHP